MLYLEILRACSRMISACSPPCTGRMAPAHGRWLVVNPTRQAQFRLGSVGDVLRHCRSPDSRSGQPGYLSIFHPHWQRQSIFSHQQFSGLRQHPAEDHFSGQAGLVGLDKMRAVGNSIFRQAGAPAKDNHQIGNQGMAECRFSPPLQPAGSLPAPQPRPYAHPEGRMCSF